MAIKTPPPRRTATAAATAAAGPAAPTADATPAAEKAETKTVAKRAPVPKPAPKGKATKTAIENVVPKVKEITSKVLSAPQLQVLELVYFLKNSTPLEAKGKNGEERTMIRQVDERGQAYLNRTIGVKCHSFYSGAEDVAKITKHVKDTVPKEYLRAISKKWFVRAYPDRAE